MILSRRPPFLPPPAELAWYLVLRKIRRWAMELTEEETVGRAMRAASNLAQLSGRPPGAFKAMARGLAQSMYVRTHGISILKKFDNRSLDLWKTFAAEAAALRKAVFVSGHLGPFELQVDLMAPLPQKILFVYRAYRWPPLARLVEPMRLCADNLRYLEFRRTRQILQSLNNGHSLAMLADHAPPARALPVFGRLVLDVFPLRVALRENVPLFVGGLFNRSSSDLSFGFDYYKILPQEPKTAEREYAGAFEKTVRNNPGDWIRFS